MKRNTILKTLVVAAAIAISGLSNAVAQVQSPAQQLFEQAGFYLDFQYFGPSKVVVKDLIAKYQEEINKACQADGEKCAYEKAEPIIEQMFFDMQDGHTYYLTAEDVAQERAVQGGSAQSAGLRIGFTHRGFFDKDNKPISPDRMVIEVLPDSPAEKAGLRIGDRWGGYNGQAFNGKTVEEINAQIAAFREIVNKGDFVTMNIIRGTDRQKLELKVKGERVNLVNLPKMEIRADKIAVIRHPDFQPQGAGNRVHQLVKQAQDQGAVGIILDMRGNGGGISTERWITVGAFIANPEANRRTARYNTDVVGVEEGYADGKVVYRDLKGQTLQTVPAQNPTLWTGPVSVLVDSGCASACEYTAANFQRTKRGAVIGEQTAGVGNTNTERFGLINGGAAGIPTRRATWTDGTLLPEFITPDVVVENGALELFNTGRDIVLEKGIAALNLK